MRGSEMRCVSLYKNALVKDALFSCLQEAAAQESSTERPDVSSVPVCQHWVEVVG